ncbi:MAG TPA: glycosyltransferase 87 family protein [Candidatus Dormibacteraeota bacterium]|nr:glycosyltransferase 87 family protein [Candidatus Dormibacteraeota bacterium]
MARELAERITAAGVAVGGAFLLGGMAAASILTHAPQGVRNAVAAPVAVVTWQGDWGLLLWSALALAIAGGSVVYVYLLREIWHAADVELAPARPLLAAILATSALAAIAAASFPVLFSSDVYAYGWYGDLALHGLSPYLHAHVTPFDPLMRAAAAQWGNPPPISVYGPLFTWISAVMVRAASPLGAAAQLDAFRALAVVSLLACAALAFAVTRDWEPRRRMVLTAGIALNPVAIWSCTEGHNDALMLALVLGGILLARRGGTLRGACAIALTALVKATSVVAAALFVMHAGVRRGSRGGRRALLGSAAGLAAVALFSVPFERGIAGALARHAHYAPTFSPQWMAWMLAAQVLPAGAPALAIGCTVVVLAAGAVALRGIRMARAGDRTGYAVIALAAWLVLPNAYPWYALWVLPLALAAVDSRVGLALLALTLTSTIRYVFDAAYGPGHPAYNLVAAMLQYGPPLLLLVAPPVPVGASAPRPNAIDA